jgi:hypothetical protein
MSRLDPLRIVIAVGSLAIGGLHLWLYFDSYRDIPIENVGRSFVANAVASVVVAAVVLLWRHPLALLAPLLFANATLIAFAMSRTDRGVFNFTESGWDPSPQAALSVVIEIATAAACVAAMVLELRRSTAAGPSSFS